MIVMVTTHLFSPSLKLKSFKEAIGKCKFIFGARNNYGQYCEPKKIIVKKEPISCAFILCNLLYIFSLNSF